MRPPMCGSPLGSLRNTAKGHRPLGNHLGCVIRHVRYAAVRLRTRKPVPISSAQTSKSPALNLTLAASHTRCRMHRCTSSSWQHRYQAGVVAEGDQEFHTFGLEFLKERNRGGRKSGKTKFPSFPIRLVSSDVTSVPETKASRQNNLTILLKYVLKGYAGCSRTGGDSYEVSFACAVNGRTYASAVGCGRGSGLRLGPGSGAEWRDRHG